MVPRLAAGPPIECRRALKTRRGRPVPHHAGQGTHYARTRVDGAAVGLWFHRDLDGNAESGKAISMAMSNVAAAPWVRPGSVMGNDGLSELEVRKRRILKRAAM